MRRTLLATGSNINGRLGINDDEQNKDRKNNSSSSVCRALTPISLIRHEEKQNQDSDINQHPAAVQAGALPSISCGRAHSLLVEDGQLYGWGCNDFGQVGVVRETDMQQSDPSKSLSNNAERSVEVEVEEKNDTDLEVEEQEEGQEEEEEKEGHAEEEEEEVPVIGASSNTLSTHPQHCDIPTPTHIPIPSCERIVQVSCGAQHSLCTTQSGKVYSWGCGAYGATGHGDELTRHRPDLIRQTQADDSSTTTGTAAAISFDNECIVGVCAGQNHSLVLTQRGAVYSFGRGQEGQLGDGYALFNPPPKSSNCNNDDGPTATTGTKISAAVHCRMTPYRIASLDNAATPAIILACSNGGHGSYAVLASGGVVRWGALCDSTHLEHSADIFCNAQNPTSTPVPLPCPLGSTSSGGGEPSSSTISAAAAAPLVLTKTSSSDNASISSNNNNSSTTAESMVISISAGSNHVVCVTRAGEAWSLGSKGPHLGIGPACQYHWIRSPSRMLLPGDVLVNGVSCGERHTLLSTTDGRIFACGDAAFGKLGLMNEDLEKASDALGAIPKAVSISFQHAHYNSAASSRSNNHCKDVLYGTYVGPMSYATERVLQHLREEAAAALQDAPSQGTIYKNCHLNDSGGGGGGECVDVNLNVPSSVSVHVNVTTPRSPELEIATDDAVDHCVNDDELSYELDMEYFSANTTQQNSSSASNQQMVTSDDNAVVATSIPMTQCSSASDVVMAAPHGMAGISTPNKTLGWQRRLSYEAKRKLSHGGRILWGASGAIINNVVTRVTGSHGTSSTSVGGHHGADHYFSDSIASASHYHHNMQMTTAAAAAVDMSHHDTTVTGGGASNTAADGMIVGSVDSHQDSFDGFLAGKARRKVLLAAGGSSSLVYILDDA